MEQGEQEQRIPGIKVSALAQAFLQNNWYGYLLPKWRLRTRFVELAAEDVEFLTDDQTNPDCQKWPKADKIRSLISELGGNVFLKAGNRTPKDCSILMQQVRSLEEMVMLFKVSEYMSEAICEELSDRGNATMVIRKYQKRLESGQDQFRAYFKSPLLVAIGQKCTNFLGNEVTSPQVEAIKKTAEYIEDAIKKRWPNQSIQFIVELYCSRDGSETRVLAIEPFHDHGLSLFSNDQLQKQWEVKGEPLVRRVASESDMKEVDLHSYRAGREVGDYNIQEWNS